MERVKRVASWPPHPACWNLDPPRRGVEVALGKRDTTGERSERVSERSEGTEKPGLQGMTPP